ncbi:hypothetical protein ABVK25_009471 [Lepraria finkii]|uniref:Uncharacterized protein n=1 Tax=Lepraria finkii TaxID=1340010 RepID=A0ABR4AXF9_9LECA
MFIWRHPYPDLCVRNIMQYAVVLYGAVRTLQFLSGYHRMDLSKLVPKAFSPFHSTSMLHHRRFVMRTPPLTKSLRRNDFLTHSRISAGERSALSSLARTSLSIHTSRVAQHQAYTEIIASLWYQ